MNVPRLRITIRGMMVAVVAAALECWLVVSSPFGYVIALGVIGAMAGVLWQEFRDGDRPRNYMVGAVCGGLAQWALLGLVSLGYSLRHLTMRENWLASIVGVVAGAILVGALSGLLVGTLFEFVRAAASALTAPWNRPVLRANDLAEPGFKVQQARDLFDERLPGDRRLSQDDIVFDEVRYREPARLRRPDRDRRFACLAYEVPAEDDLPIFLDHAAADSIERHALRDTSVELGGILLGKECVDDQTGAPFVLVTKSLEARHYENTQASFTYTHDSWEEITRERDKRYPELDIVGWYHTHPDFGVFLSSHDLFIHRHFFSEPLQVAYVVDPIRHARGFFRWRDGQMEPTGGFYLTAERGERIALARVANDLEDVPNASAHADGIGGGLSPRLEAELIAMLTRPATHAHASSAAERTQTALIFAMLGGMLGVLGLSAVLWLNTLNATVNDQSRALDELRKTVADSADRQRVALDAALGDAGGSSPKEFIERYARAVRQRDEARRQVETQLTANALLDGRVKALHEELASAKKAEADATADLRARVNELETTRDRQARALAELDELLKTAAGDKATALAVSYRNTWYAAVGGWAVSLILALGLGGMYVHFRSPPAEPHQVG